MKALNNSQKANLKRYVLSCINPEYYGFEAKTNKKKVQFVLDCFNEEYNFFNNKKRLPQLKKRLAEWLEGLPGVFEVSYYHEDIETDLKTLGFITTTSTKEEISNAVTGWFELVAGGLLDLAKELNLNTNHLNKLF